jgi:hypothetical protein
LARITQTDKERMWAESETNPLTPGDFHSDIGPLAVASAFVRDIADGNFEDAWLIVDPTWRLCRAQAWIYNNLEPLGCTDDPELRDQLAEHLVNGPHPTEQIWRAFAGNEASALHSAVGDFNDDRWGWSQRRRILGPGHEVILASPLPAHAPNGFIVDQPTLLAESIHVLVSSHRLNAGVLYLVAGLNGHAAPSPGWPPTWWVLDDPAALACHPGLTPPATTPSRELPPRDPPSPMR